MVTIEQIVPPELQTVSIIYINSAIRVIRASDDSDYAYGLECVSLDYKRWLATRVGSAASTFR